MTTSPPHDAQADKQPWPPRYWWLKRIAVAVAILLLAVLIFRLAIGEIAARRYAARIARLEALDEPIGAADFQRPPLPDEQNAAPVLLAAVEALVTQVDEIQLSTLLRQAAEIPRRPDDVDRLLAANAETLRLVRAARSRPDADWGLDFSQGMVGVQFPDFFEQLSLADLVLLTAQRAADRGDHAAAVAYLRDTQHMAGAINEGDLMLAHLAGHLITLKMASLAEDIAPTLRIAPTPAPASNAPTAAARADVTALIHSLLDEAALQRGWFDAMCIERAFMIATIECFIADPFDRTVLGRTSPASLELPGFLGWWVTPVIRFDAIFALNHADAHVNAARATSAVDADRVGITPALTGTLVDRLAGPLSHFIVPQYGDVYRRRFEIIAQRRLLATRLALRLYEVDHGRRPATLDELVPAYLPAVPRDPMLAAEPPIRYEPGGARPRLFAGHPDWEPGAPAKSRRREPTEMLLDPDPPPAIEARPASQPQ